MELVGISAVPQNSDFLRSSFQILMVAVINQFLTGFEERIPEFGFAKFSKDIVSNISYK